MKTMGPEIKELYAVTTIYVNGATWWYGTHGLWGGFQDAYWMPKADAKKKLLEIQEDDPDFENYSIRKFSETIPSQKFLDVLPLDQNNIPPKEQEIRLIWRDGYETGVFLDFIRDELLKGRWHRNPELARWYKI